MTRQKRRIRAAVLWGLGIMLVGIIGGCAGGTEKTAAPQQPQSPAAAAAPAPAAPAAEPKPVSAPAPTAGLAAPPSKPAQAAAPASSKAAAEQLKVFPQDGTPQYGGILRLARLEDPKILNYLDRAGPYTLIAINGIYESLVLLDWRANYLTYGEAVAPGMAKSWETSSDGTVWTFHLRDNVRWHDGTPVTSADVKATYDHFLNPGKADPAARSYVEPFVASVEAPDPKTVVLKLKAPSPVLLNNLSVHWTGIAPKAALDQGMDGFKTSAIGSGPFKWVPDKWVRGISYEWVRNPDYWEEGVPFLDGRKHFIILDRATQIAAFETKRIDDTWEAGPKQTQTLREKYGDKMQILQANGGAFRQILINVEHPPFDNPKVRQALYLWWDRQEFLDKASDGSGELGEWLNPGLFKSPKGEGYGTPYSELVKKNLAFKPDKTEARQRARELLVAAGLTDLSKIKVKVVVQTSAGIEFKGNQVLTAQLRQLGFDPQFQVLDPVAGLKAQTDGDFDILFRGGLMPFPGPDGVLNRYLAPGGSRNYTRVKDPLFDQWQAELNRTIDPSKRAGLLNRFDQYFQEGHYPIQIMYWELYGIVRWEYNKGRKYMQIAGSQPDDRAWLGPEAPGRR